MTAARDVRMSTIRFEGDRTFPLPPTVVAAKLTDAAFLVGCLRNVEHVAEAAPDKAVWKLRTGFSFLSTTLEIALTVLERTETSATFKAFSRASSVQYSAGGPDIYPKDSGTLVHYTATWSSGRGS